MPRKELLARRFELLYAPMAALFLTRHVTSARAVLAGDWRQRIRNASTELKAGKPWRAIRALTDRRETKLTAEVEFGGDFPLSEIRALVTSHAAVADRHLMSAVASAERSRYENDAPVGVLTDKEFELFKHIESEYSRLSTYSQALRVGPPRSGRTTAVVVPLLTALIAAAGVILGGRLQRGSITLPWAPQQQHVSSSDSGTVVLIGSGTVFQYLKSQVQPHLMEGVLGASLVDAGSHLGARILAASTFSPGSGIDLLAMSSATFEHAVFDSSHIVPGEYVYEVLVGRCRPWIAVGAPTPEVRDRVFGALFADAKLRNSTKDGVPVVSRSAALKFLWPGGAGQPAWHIWTTSGESGTLTDFNAFLGGPGTAPAWPSSAEPYEGGGFDDALKTHGPWIAIGNEFLNTRPVSGEGPESAPSWRKHPDVRVFFLTPGSLSDSVWTEGLFLYGRVPTAKSGKDRVPLPPRVAALLSRLLESKLAGISDTERESQRDFFQLRDDPTTKGGGVFVGGASNVVLRGWRSTGTQAVGR